MHAATLTGDGERARLCHTGISLQTHIDGVLGLIDAEELHDIVLVGHNPHGAGEGQAGWRIVELATGHCPMLSAPQALTRVLLDLS